MINKTRNGILKKFISYKISKRIITKHKVYNVDDKVKMNIVTKVSTVSKELLTDIFLTKYKLIWSVNNKLQCRPIQNKKHLI